MNLKRALLISFLFILMAFCAFAPGYEDPLVRLLSSFQKWSAEHKQEKVYLHMDRPNYLLGDTIWFKAYVTVGSKNQLSDISGVVYVDLISPQDSILSTLKLKAALGIANGDFLIESDYGPGVYRIRAYTQWMRNAGEDFFFDHTFNVAGESGSVVEIPNHIYDRADHVTLLKNKKPKLTEFDLKFFPEGGNLVYGVSSRVGFKAMDLDGNGIEAKGVILDKDNNEISTFETGHVGMGSLVLKPQIGQTYSAKAVLKDGSSKLFVLPVPKTEGYVLAVTTLDSESLEINIHASTNLEMKTEDIGVIIQMNGELMFSKIMKTAGAKTVFHVDKRSFPNGIAQVTLFNSSGLPVCERLVFIDNHHQMQLSLSTSADSYLKRTAVAFELDAKDHAGKPVQGNFSVTVTKVQSEPMHEEEQHTIFSNLLLSSALKGYVEEPNYYFVEQINEASRVKTALDLDNLLLAQGYRTFDWNSIINGSTEPPIFWAEKDGIDISGRVTTSGNPVASGRVTLLSTNGGVMEEAITNDDGRFTMTGLNFPDGLNFIAEAHSDKKGTRAELHLETGFASPKVTKRSPVPSNHSVQKTESSVGLGMTTKTTRLKEVKIKAKKNIPPDYSPQLGLTVPEGHSDQTYVLTDAEKCPNLSICLQGKLAGVIWGPYAGAQSFPHTIYTDPVTMIRKSEPMTIVLDGRKLDSWEAVMVFESNYIEPADILKIEVVRVNLALMAMLTNTPTLLIMTKAKTYNKKEYIPNAVYFSRKGFNKARRFYSPTYERKSRGIVDRRSTIYWEPNMKTGKDGAAFFQFYTGDNVGTFRVTVEGISADGELGRSTYRLNIKSGSK